MGRKVWQLVLAGDAEAEQVEVSTEFLTGARPQIVVPLRFQVLRLKVPPWVPLLSLTFCNAIRFGAFGSADGDDEEPTLFQEDEDFDEKTCDQIVLTSVQNYDWDDENLFLDYSLFCALSTSTRQLLSESSEKLGHKDLVLTTWEN
jgi:hypothetical protein